MPEFRFRLGDRVRVSTSRSSDPGGTGEVTAREVKEDDQGTKVLYRVKIDGHAGQEEVAREKGRRNFGFWYPEGQVSSA